MISDDTLFYASDRTLREERAKFAKNAGPQGVTHPLWGPVLNAIDRTLEDRAAIDAAFESYLDTFDHI